MKKIEFDEKCKSCKGTGLFQGMAEKEGFAVVCHTCKGTGKHRFVHEYEEFTGREIRADIKRVIKTNPGIRVGGFRNFGGMSYEDWAIGKPFPAKSEMREYTCPAWWYQSADYDKKPYWDECMGCGMFSACFHFCNKQKCWERWDKEQEAKSK